MIKLALALTLLLSPLSLSAKQHMGPKALSNTILEVAFKEGAPPFLVLAICTVESSLRSYVINPNDGDGTPSYGLCQLKLRTARWLNCSKTKEDLLKADLNALCAARYIKYQLRRYGHVWEHAIAAYNLGSLRRTRKGKIVNISYVKKVQKQLKRLKHAR